MAPDGTCLQRPECSCPRCLRQMILKHRGELHPVPSDHAARHQPHNARLDLGGRKEYRG